TSVRITKMYATLASGGRRDGKPGGLKPGTLKLVHCVLRASLARAVEDKALAISPLHGFKAKRRLPKVDKAAKAVLSPPQMMALLDALRSHPLFAPVLLAVATGCRRSEALAVRWRHIDLDRGTVIIAESLEQTRTGLRFKGTKTNKARTVAL